MWTNRNILASAVLLIFLAACSTTKTVNTVGGSAKELSKKERKILIDAISEKELKYETFSTKAKTRLSVDNKSFNSTLNIRIKNNETIWISATAFLGIEAARIKITPNRIQILNRLQSTYIDKPFEYIYNYTTRELTFNELEDLLVGNAMGFYDNDVNQTLILDDSFMIIGQLENLDFEMKLKENYSLQQTKLSDGNRSQTVQVNYNNFQEVGSSYAPGQVKIRLNAEKVDLNAEMAYEELNLDQNLDFPFSVPEKYKKL